MDFLSLSDANIRYVVLGSILLTASSAIVGCFTFLQKKSLLGDAVAHSVLPGICIAFMLSGTKNPLYLALGALLSGWLSILALNAITRYTKIKQDTATGLVLSVFFGIGIFMLTIIQNSGNAEQSGLHNFLFGKAASLLFEDVLVFGGIALLLVLSVLLLYKELKLITFDPAFARSAGIAVQALELTLNTLTVLAIVVGIQAVGVVLMAALLITPAAAARYWTNQLPLMLLLAAIFGAFSGYAGAGISYLAPAMPTGPWIVFTLSLVALLSFFLAPKKGILYHQLNRFHNSRKQQEDSLLKFLYQLGQQKGDFEKSYTLEELKDAGLDDHHRIRQALTRLLAQNLLKRSHHTYYLTASGLAKGRRITQLHQLYDTYLRHYGQVNNPPLSEDWQGIEDIITPELEVTLSKLQQSAYLKNPLYSQEK